MLWIVALGALLGSACTRTNSMAVSVCRDPVTKLCVACPETGICVDPVSCKIIECHADIAFGQGDATPTGDAGTSDAGTADSGSSGDGKSLDSDAGGVSDAASPEVLDSGADVPPDNGPDLAVCSPGQSRCEGSAIQNCMGGQWQTVAACNADLTCENAACVCKNSCSVASLIECVPGAAAVHTCTKTQSGCLVWSDAVACPAGQACNLGQCQTVSTGCNPACVAGQVCQNGLCVPGGGGALTCSQLAACIGNCPEADPNCPNNCKAQGSASGLSLLNAYQGCLKAVCKSLADQGKFNETMLCVYSNCFSEQQACIGSGSGDCKKTSDCMATCGSSATCSTNCNAAASQQGAKDYYGLLTCIDNQCGALSGQAQLTCAQNGCKSLWDSCYPSTPVLYTSCLQVANCQAKCGGDLACAKACKAAASPEAQAAVDAFITCRDTKCGGYCGGSNTTNCMQCVQIYCPNQLDACSY
ncbi:MAG: hypothetical protein HY902_03455 [Deltaproteobacteria bacterium]|nr:hypothetical protein [Deltaproteobacteria bacterium]